MVPIWGVDSIQTTNILKGAHNEGGMRMTRALKFLVLCDENGKQHWSGIVCLGGAADVNLDEPNDKGCVECQLW